MLYAAGMTMPAVANARHWNDCYICANFS